MAQLDPGCLSILLLHKWNPVTSTLLGIIHVSPQKGTDLFPDV